jgi:anti-anti-sigma regulatory factor
VARVGPDAVVGGLRAGDHVCATFGTAAQRRAVLREFTRVGVRAGDKVICFLAGAPGGLTVHGGRPGQVRFTSREHGDATYRNLLRRLVDEIDLAGREGYPGLRLAGDMGWVLDAQSRLADQPALVEYESAATALIGRGGAVGLCLYDRRRFSVAQLRAVEAVHTGTAPVRDGALLRFAFTPTGISLAGEVDESNLGALIAALAGLGPYPVLLDATELRFLSCAGAGVILRAASGRPMRVLCRPTIARTLRLAGADAITTLSVGATGVAPGLRG